MSLFEYFQQATLAEPLRYLLLISSLTLLPLFFVALTCFTRFIIVFSLLRFSLGLQQTPPNVVLLTLAFFMTLYAMGDTFKNVEHNVIIPYTQERLSTSEAIEDGSNIMKTFMVSQTRPDDMRLILSLQKKEMPNSLEQLNLLDVIPAFLISELTTAFKIGFVIFIPFLLVDLVVASILMSLGIIMLPPVTVSLPIKIMLFILIDGWALVTQTLVSSV